MALRAQTIIYDSLTADPVAPVDGEHWFNVTEGKHKRRVAGATEYVPSTTGATSPVGVHVGDAALVGTATDASRADHQHALAAPAAPVNVDKSAASAGVATTVARADHKHDITTAAAVANPPSTANAEGVSTSLARADHTHALAAFGSTAGTFAQGNDARLSDDRTAAGLRSATTVVAVSSAVAPTAGQVLTALTGASANWQSLAGITSPFKQSIFAEKAADATTTSTTFVTLLSQAITLAGSTSLLIHFSAGVSNTTNAAITSFRVTVDGVAKRGTSFKAPSASGAGGVAIILKVDGLSAGAHTVLVEWKVSGGTGQVRPVAAVDAEHASLLLEEVAV